MVAHADSRTTRDEVIQTQHEDYVDGSVRGEAQPLVHQGALYHTEANQLPRLY